MYSLTFLIIWVTQIFYTFLNYNKLELSYSTFPYVNEKLN